MKTANHEFKQGDTVKLASGGPCMTVETLIIRVARPDYIGCKWFTPDHKLERGVFHYSTLRLA